uniref:hypothetical protein n=1 Tax=Pleurocordyceps sinensis TaxID=99896 RepID=UPI0022001760|nr:hypothetical protein OOD12_mgp16 [Pleurocordyceps sinensis]UXR11751.1 hypothetical protein [Pleurocordyceps sinensis]
MVIVNSTIKNNLNNISKLLTYVNIDTLYIVTIILDEEFKFEATKIEEPSKVLHIEMGLIFFMERFLRNPNYDFWKHNKNTIYILKEGSYAHVRDIFTAIGNEKVQIVRGSSQKSHIISPIDFRLSCYMLVLCNLNYNICCSRNAFNVLTKDRYLPSWSSKN